MVALNSGQVWLLFRNERLARELYGLIEASDPQLLQSVEPDQPLLFQPDPNLPLWVVSDFHSQAWSEVIEKQEQLQAWWVLGAEMPVSPPARALSMDTFKQVISAPAMENKPHPAEADEEGVFDHRLALGDWLLCDRHSTSLLKYEPGFTSKQRQSPPLGKPIESWLIPAGKKRLSEWFSQASDQRPVQFRALRWTGEDERSWVDVFCMPSAADESRMQCHLIDRSGEVRLESGLSLLNRGTRLGTLAQMQHLLSSLCEWAEADYAAVVLEQEASMEPVLLAEAGPIRPGESQWLQLADIMNHMQGGRLELPERAEVSLPENQFVREHGLESVLVWEIEQEQKGLAALVLVARESMPYWKNLVRLVSVLARILGQELNLQAMKNLVNHQKTVDRLTGLSDRAGLIQELLSLAEQKQQAGLLLIQMDSMESLRQAHTQEELDLLLRQLGRWLKAVENHSIRAFRPMEDGFALLLAGSWQRKSVQKLAHTLLQSLERGIQVPAIGVQSLSASMGFVAFPDHADRPRELMRRAQLVVSEARKQGGARLVFYDHDLGRVQLQKGRLLKDIPNALQQGQFQVHYQAKVSASSEDIVGMEALVRWEHPELGMISPAVFIPLAEESEWIVELGEYVLVRACEFAREMNARFDLRLVVGVNVAQRQLLENEFVQRLQKILDSTGLQPEHLDMEVTETQRMLNQKEVKTVLQHIRQLGCTVAIDDFGTGQSTLEDLRQIPADHVKLDQSFVRNIGIDPHDEAIIRATIEMCHQLGLHIVAEGIETEQQRQFLADLGCEILQGYLFSRPLSAVEFTEMLKARADILQQASQPSLDPHDRQWING